jgi:hypothetical protein
MTVTPSTSKWLEWGQKSEIVLDPSLELTQPDPISYLLGLTKNHAMDRKRKPDIRHNHNVKLPSTNNNEQSPYIKSNEVYVAVVCS